ncbi:MAG: hypothetical protein WCJ39_02000 [bacterium]
MQDTPQEETPQTPEQTKQTSPSENIPSPTITQEIPAQDLHLDALQAEEEEIPKPSFSIHLDEDESLENTSTADPQVQETPSVEEQIQQGVEEPAEEVIQEPVLEQVEQTQTAPIPEQKEIPVSQEESNPLVQKFQELYTITQNIAEIRKTATGFDVLGADNDKLRISYNFFAGDEQYPLLLITKKESDKALDEETEHELSFYLNEEKTALSVTIDDTILFDQADIDSSDTKTKMQITDKLNKFLFLLNEELRKIEKEKQEKEAQEQERKKLQDVFRNF